MKIKVQVIEQFTLGRFDEITNIVRKNADKHGMLFKGDTFECTREMAEYLTGKNEKGKIVVKIIEVIPEKDISPKDTIIESENIIPLANKEELNKLGEELLKHIKISKTSKK